MPQQHDVTADAAMPGLVGEMVSTEALHGSSTPATPISAHALAAVIALGCVALLMMGIQPLVLGAFQSAGRLSIPQMGQAATLETLALGVVSAGMAARVRHRRLRTWGLAGGLVLVAANAAGLFTSGLGFVLSRGLAGAASGVVVWLAVGLITRRHDAGRVNAIFLGAQALTQGAVAALIPVTIGPALGSSSGLWIIAGTAGLALPLLWLVPSELPAPPLEAKRAASLHLSSLSGLASCLLMMAGIVGLWVYVEPIGRAIQVPERIISFAIAASLGAQVLGAALVVAVDRWLKPVAGLLAAAAAFLAVTAVFAWIPSQAAFVAAILVFGFLWILALALGLPLLIAADPTRRAPMYGPAATLLGSSLGPLAAGAFATESNLRPALAASAVLFVLTAVAVLISARTRRSAS